jgi:hypothetical protein
MEDSPYSDRRRDGGRRGGGGRHSYGGGGGKKRGRGEYKLRSQTHGVAEGITNG